MKLRKSKNRYRTLNKRIVVVSGPSGVGKTTLCEHLMRKEPRIEPCVTATTRPPRAGEINARDYLFLSKGDFTRGIKEGKFVEYTGLFGNYYGTPKESLEQVFKRGRYPLLRVDVKGAQNLKRLRYKGVYIFIVPPDVEALKKRLVGRSKKASKAELARRLKRARYEMKMAHDYDFIVVNDKIQRAVNEIRNILKKHLYRKD